LIDIIIFSESKNYFLINRRTISSHRVLFLHLGTTIFKYKNFCTEALFVQAISFQLNRNIMRGSWSVILIGIIDKDKSTFIDIINDEIKIAIIIEVSVCG